MAEEVRDQQPRRPAGTISRRDVLAGAAGAALGAALDRAGALGKLAERTEAPGLVSKFDSIFDQVPAPEKGADHSFATKDNKIYLRKDKEGNRSLTIIPQTGDRELQYDYKISADGVELSAPVLPDVPSEESTKQPIGKYQQVKLDPKSVDDLHRILDLSYQHKTKTPAGPPYPSTSSNPDYIPAVDAPIVPPKR